MPLSPSSSSDLVYSTYIGGNSDDFGNGIAVDSAGNTYVVGATRSTDFPKQDPLQSVLISLQDAFVTKLSADGSALIYSTYLGGDSDDLGNDIAVDTSGNAYITGTTQSNDFPTEDAFQPNRSSLRDVFVAKVNQTGEALLYSTYLGGSLDDLANGITVDSEGNAYIVGTTVSVDFPTTTGVFEQIQQGAQDAFVSKLDPFGDSFIYSTYLGGSGDDFGNGVAVDSSGNAYVTGTTQSGDFPTVNFFDNSLGGAQDAFVSKFDPSLSGVASLIYSTYLGGANDDLGNSIAVDTSNNAYVVGTTLSNDFPIQNAFQAANAGSNDAFVTKLKADGTAPLIYSTYLGGSNNDLGNGIAVDTSNNAYVAGTTLSDDFPVKNPLQPTRGGDNDAFISGDNDAFISKFNSAGSVLTYSTYLGGSMDDFGSSIAVDISGNAHVTGTTVSDNFPTENAFQADRGGLQDSFVTKVNAAGDTLIYSSYLGGNQNDLGNDVAVDGLGNAFVTGSTLSNDFPTKSVQNNPGGGNDGFVAKVQEEEVTGNSTGGGNEASGGGGGASCFISTAGYGSSMARKFQPLSVIFILLALLCTTLFVLFRRLKLREVVFKTARLKSK
jgi:preprotein translocase subunit SecG